MAMYRRGNRRRRYVLLLLVLTAITLITLDRRSDDDGPLGVVGRVAHRIVSPVASGVDWVADPVGDWFSGVFDSGSLQDDNEELRERIDELERQLDQVDSALEENRQFKDLLALPITDDIDRVYARVIAGAPGNFEQTLTLLNSLGDELRPLEGLEEPVRFHCDGKLAPPLGACQLHLGRALVFSVNRTNIVYFQILRHQRLVSPVGVTWVVSVADLG